MRNFSEFLEQLIIDQGSQLNVAAATKIESTRLSRFRSDQCGLTRSDIDKLLEIGGATIATEREIRRYEETIDHLATMWLRERRRKEERPCRRTG